MPRYALLVEYDGGPFAGWQRQADQPSVQGAIEAALARLEERAHTIAAAGRTDAGVHARGQVAQCDMARDWEPFRLMEALNYHLKPAPVAIRDCARVPEDWHARAAALGADVPACVESRTCVGRGTGTELEAADDSLAGTPVLLVNPRLPLATGPVFGHWDGRDRGALPAGDARSVAIAGRNDLEGPAISLCPQIAGVLAELGGTSPILARMSGSGATCFALYESVAARDAAASQIGKLHTGWWQMKGLLR